MKSPRIIEQAERLWLRLCASQAEAHAAGDLSRELRIEPLKERAWWRLLRRLNLARRNCQKRKGGGR